MAYGAIAERDWNSGNISGIYIRDAEAVILDGTPASLMVVTRFEERPTWSMNLFYEAEVP